MAEKKGYIILKDTEKEIMEKYGYDPNKGMNKFEVTGLYNKGDHKVGRNFVDIGGVAAPTTNMASLSGYRMEQVIQATKRKGSKLSDSELKDIVGDLQFQNKAAWYDSLLDINRDTFGFGAEVAAADGHNMEPEKNPYDMITDYNSKAAQDYLAQMDAATSEQESTYAQSLEAAELESYKQIGMMQQQLESQIAQQRQQALRSGTTSAQLAVQSLNQMFAAQQGAAQVGMQVGQARMENTKMFADQRAQTRMGLGNLIQANKSGLSQVGAQNYAAFSAWDAMANAPQNYARSFDVAQLNNPSGINAWEKNLGQ